MRPLASLHKAMAWFRVFSHHCRLPCTAEEGRECHVVENVPIWNDLLFHIHCELREASGRRGQLSLRGFNFSFPRPAGRRAGELWIQQRALVSLNWLLKTHRCIGSVDQNSSNVYTNPLDGLFCDGLRGNASVKELRIQFREVSKHARLCAAISSLDRMERLECECSIAAPGGLAVALGRLLWATMCLSVLKIPRLQVTEDEGDQFVAGLRGNNTLKELSVCESGFDEVSLTNRPEFAKYLQNTTTLTALSIEAPVERSNGPNDYWRWIFEGLSANRTVRKLRLRPLTITERSAKRIAKIIAENTVLQSLELSPQSNPPNQQLAVFCNCWLEAFMDNQTLEQVRLVSPIWRVREWELFFTAVALKENLKKVTVSVSPCNRDTLPELWEILRESGARKKVLLDAGCYTVGTDQRMLECGVFTEVAAYRSKYTTPALCGTLKQTVMLSHVRYLFLQVAIRDLDGPITSAISEYFRTTTSLERLNLNATLDAPVDDLQKRSWKIVTGSLLLNNSLRHLSVDAITRSNTNDEDIQCLADSVRLSGAIHSAEYRSEQDEKSCIFVRRLSEGIEENYTLLNVSLCTSLEIDALAQWEWYSVLQTARRNSDLLTRASAFVSRARTDRRGAAALERMSRHSMLAEKVARLSSVGKTEAAAMVREAVARLGPMNEFMRLSGVVREQVVCHPRGDGRLQLDDLSEHCWAVLRRYLTLLDVKDL